MRRFPLGLVITFSCLGLLGYFTWHAMKGPRSFANYDALQVRIASLQANLDAERAKRIAFEHRVDLLRSDSIDPDLADELARQVLDFAAPGDVVVIEGPRSDTPSKQ